jgi:hypothetical protein
LPLCNARETEKAPRITAEFVAKTYELRVDSRRVPQLRRIV